MRNCNSGCSGGMANSNIVPPHLDQSDGYHYTSLYPSIFPPSPPLFSLTPSTVAAHGTNTPTAVGYNHSFDFAPFQDLIDRRNRCLSHLQIISVDSEALRQENTNLRAANVHLSGRLSLLHKAYPSYEATSSSITDGFDRMRIEDKEVDGGRAWREENQVVHGIESDRIGRAEVNRVKLPKSISVRSRGYLKTVQAGENRDGRINEQKVYVHGKQKEEPLELQVYNQGTSKTELCNKWQNTGDCPYGDSCQFAHGIEELRPILRHPRYKTEVCRMVLAGDHCPYGHRCHFRHSLTDEEKFMASGVNPKTSPLKLYR